LENIPHRDRQVAGEIFWHLFVGSISDTANFNKADAVKMATAMSSPWIPST
jgi:hypothetical protein